MSFLSLLEWFGIVVVVWGALTQIMAPLILGGPLFPIFSSRRDRILHDIEVEEDVQDAAKLGQKLEDLRRCTEELRYKEQKNATVSDRKD